nr:hypothetical protein [uncultured Carboxylicivirga sp.]
MKIFKRLTYKQIDALLKYPAYISILAASLDDTLDKAEKKAAIQIAHTKAFSSDPILLKFYKEAEKVFIKNLEQLENELPKDKISREAAIKKELLHLEKIVKRLGKKYVIALHQSMKSFKDHISRAHHNVLIDFLFPIPITGLTDR